MEQIQLPENREQSCLGSPMAALAKSLAENPPDVREAELLIDALAWKEDMQIVNPFGEHVWLKPHFVNERFTPVDPSTPGARRIGIIDCCFVDAPCARHQNMANDKISH